LGLLQAVHQGVEPWPHGLKGSGLAQRSPPLPQQAFAPQLGPDRLQQGTTALLGLLHPKRQPHPHGQHHSQMWLAMAVMVFTVVAVVVEGLTRLMFHLPSRSSPAHEAIPVACAHAHVRDPTARLDVVSAQLPGLDAIAPHICVRCSAGHVIDQAKPMDKTRDVVVPLSIAPASGVLGGLHLLAQSGVLTCCDPEKIPPMMGLEGL
jgi:hypothetical protein